MPMRRTLVVLTLATVVLPGCSGNTEPDGGSPGSKPQELTLADIRALVPEATSIANADFEALSTSPVPATIENQSLSLVLFSIDPLTESKENPAAREDFRFLKPGFPKPADLARAVTPSRSKGYATMIQARYITGFESTTRDESATGTVDFEVKGLYAGRVEFTARLLDGGWRFEEFRLPNYGVRCVLDEGGVWRKQSL